jgi:predicted GH43/DUF377 family glycosyl hydrolase
MNSSFSFIIILLIILTAGCKNRHSAVDKTVGKTDTVSFPGEIVNFIPYEENPVFTGTGTDTWDQIIRERGYIIREDSLYHMWYTGYREGENQDRHLGYATSPDGFVWTKDKNNPIFDSGWVEDMCVVKSDSTYYMFAEGRNDIAHLLISSDKIHWEEQGPLDVRYTNGEPLTKGPYGTPAVWLENGIWYLFYERDDLGIWLATSTDLKVWTNNQDEPVIKMGPEIYDAFAVAADQVIKHRGKYYIYYHASEFKDWREWTSCIAISDDLLHWKKYPGNPIMRDDRSSPLLIHDGEMYRLYTMHPEVNVYFSKTDPE